MTSKLIKLNQVVEQTALSTASIYRYIKLGTFPAPIKIGERASAWKESEIQEWIEQQAAKREEVAA